MKNTRKRRFPDNREIGVIRKNKGVRARVALVYPNVYSVGMANLGFQTVYRIFNETDGTACERAFQNNAESARRPAKTIESGRSIAEFDIIAFSISFETDYLNCLELLDRAGLRTLSRDRGADHPLVIAGGAACMINPEPVCEFMDVILIGDGEVLIPGFMECFFAASAMTGRVGRLSKIARHVQGAYVPQLYRTVGKGYEKRPVNGDVPATVRRAVTSEIESAPAVSSILTPDTVFGNACLVEISRGCPYGCRFCAAGFIYRPPRYYSSDGLFGLLEEKTRFTDRIGLVGTAYTDLKDIAGVCSRLGQKGVKLTFSSLRADAVTPELVQSMAQSGVKTAVYAPEAGSGRMRNVINKRIQTPDILNACQLLVSGGIPNLKLYFMVGLPSENEDDIYAIVDLCKEIKDVFLEASRIRKRIGTITVNVNPFVPKPFTPFQRCAMDTVPSLKSKIGIIQSGLKNTANVRVHAESPRRAQIQAVLSTGNASVGNLIKSVSANNGNWASPLKTFFSQTGEFHRRHKPAGEPLPWSLIDHGISNIFLEKEYEKALSARISPPCPMTDDCRRCGVC